MLLWKFCQHAGYKRVPGEYVPWPQFRDEFRRWAAEQGCDPKEWTRAKIQAEFGGLCPIGRGPGSKTIIGNLSNQFSEPRKWVRVDGDKVRLQKPTATV